MDLVILYASQLSTVQTIDSVLIPLLGQPLNVLAGAIIGTISGFAFSETTNSRSQLFLLSFACVFLGTTGASLLPLWLDLPLYDVKKHASSLAIILSFSIRFVIPFILKKADSVTDKIVDKYLGPKGE